MRTPFDVFLPWQDLPHVYLRCCFTLYLQGSQ